jgi:NADH-quinone oxidoreductase subunit E
VSANRGVNDPSIQPKDFAFDAASEAEIEKILARYPEARKASGVIPLLYVVQAQLKRETGSAWVPKPAMDVIARRLSMPPVRVYEVASFYTMFNLRPVGKVQLQACTTTPCWLRGSDEVVAACKRATGISEFGETSADGMFTLTEVECVGACVNAPVLVVDEDFYEDLDGPRTEELIAALRRGERPPIGSTTGRQTSAPEGGPITLTEVPPVPVAGE